MSNQDQEFQRKVTQQLQSMIGSMTMTIAQLTVERDVLQVELARLREALEEQERERSSHGG